MAGDLFYWTDSASADAAIRVGTTGADMQSAIATMNAMVATNEGWHGPEFQTFSAVQKSCADAARAVAGVLDGVSKLIDNAGQSVLDYKEQINKALDG